MASTPLQRNVYRNASEALRQLSRAVLEHGEEVGSRNGERVLELTNVSFSLTHPVERVLLNPGRRASLPAQIAETVWVLSGRNDIGWLSNYLPRAAEFSDDGETWRGGYGPRLRSWPCRTSSVARAVGASASGNTIDQLAHVVDLLRRDATTRRAVINIYDPAVDAAGGKDVPCNNWIQFLSRSGRLDMHVVIRSNDLWWGWSGINAFEWSTLQQIVAEMLGINPGRLHFTIGSLHLYDRHWKRASSIGQPLRLDSGRAPGFKLGANSRTVAHLDALLMEWFRIEEDLRTRPWRDWTETIESFPEPMLRSWLYVLAWWWADGYDHVTSYIQKHPAPLAFGAGASPNRPAHTPNKERAAAMARHPSSARHLPHVRQALSENRRTVNFEDAPHLKFVGELAELHREKDAAYGDSWKRRGEVLGALANIARKIDRLGGAETADETSVDTASDLLIYLVKYWLLLTEGTRRPEANANHAELVADQLDSLAKKRLTLTSSREAAEELLRNLFTRLEGEVEKSNPDRTYTVVILINLAYRLAFSLWSEANSKRALPYHNYDPEGIQEVGR